MQEIESEYQHSDELRMLMRQREQLLIAAGWREQNQFG